MFVPPFNAKVGIVQAQHEGCLVNLKDVEAISSRPTITDPEGVSIATVIVASTAIGSASMFPSVTL